MLMSEAVAFLCRYFGKMSHCERCAGLKNIGNIVLMWRMCADVVGCLLECVNER